MRQLRRTSHGLGLLCTSIALLGAAPAAAFHDGGVAACSGCHVMHDSQDGVPVVLDGVGAALLLAGSGTDLCLSCHESGPGAVIGPDPLTPPPEMGAGSFVHLLEENIDDAPGSTAMLGGHRSGHSIVAPSWGLGPDLDFAVAPGGSYPSSSLGCTSCHDPHGSGAYRMLRDAGSVTPDGFVFANAAPAAVGVDLAGGAESSTNHAAYRSGWSRWCANCHGLYHWAFSPDFGHPVDRALGMAIRNGYNTYAGAGNPTGGDAATAYIPEVALEGPFTQPDSPEGAQASSRLSCVTCHRAHGSSAPAGLRWDGRVLLLADDGAVSGSHPLPSPYLDPDQRSLCVKCHHAEAVDHGMDAPCLDCHRSGGPGPG